MLFNHQWRIEQDSQTGSYKSHNEDRLGYQNNPALAIVCDGVGGNRHGEIAAQLACDFLMEQLQSKPAKYWSEDLLKTLVKDTHKCLLDYMRSHPNTQGMATTLVMALQSGRYAWLCWVGDSRAYLIRDGQLQQLTQDHSFVEEKVAQGVFTPQEAAVHPMANLITSSLGGAPNSLKHLGCLRLKLKKHDRLVLSSDGVHGYMDDRELLAAGQVSAKALTAQALANDTRDNCSAICIVVE